MGSLEGCGPQERHLDYPSKSGNTFHHISPMINVNCFTASSKSYFVILALMNKTQLSVSAFGGPDMTTVNINKGDVFIGRGDLIHAGMPYDSFNIRLHMYFDYPKCGRRPNQTYVMSGMEFITHKRSWTVCKEMVRLRTEKREALKQNAQDVSLRMVAAKKRKRAELSV